MRSPSKVAGPLSPTEIKDRSGRNRPVPTGPGGTPPSPSKVYKTHILYINMVNMSTYNVDMAKWTLYAKSKPFRWKDRMRPPSPTVKGGTTLSIPFFFPSYY